MNPSTTRPLFLVGNKRSGTSLLVRLVNLHPRVFVSHESDIAWILYQFYRGESFEAHPWDSDRGMRTTLDLCGHLLQRHAPPKENLATIQSCLMRTGTPWLPSMDKGDVEWIGDKKPFQHTDPRVIDFILDEFPDAHFLHIVRHPFAVVASSNRFNRTRDGDFWLGLSDEEKLERWVFHEQQVLQLKRRVNGRLHSLRHEDLCSHTERELLALFRFLGYEADAQLLAAAAREVRPLARTAPTANRLEIMPPIAGQYGYTAHRPVSRVRAARKWFSGRAAKLQGT